MRHVLISIAVLSVVFVLAGCGGGETTSPSRGTAFTGTVTHVSLEGGFYGIIAASGEKLLPTDLPSGMRKDGLKVQGVYVPAEQQMGIQMWGKRVRLLSIEALSAQ